MKRPQISLRLDRSRFNFNRDFCVRGFRKRAGGDGGGGQKISTAGMVYISIGENRFPGGKNNSNGGFSFPITNATVTIDGKPVIKDGKLLM